MNEGRQNLPWDKVGKDSVIFLFANHFTDRQEESESIDVGASPIRREVRMNGFFEIASGEIEVDFGPDPEVKNVRNGLDLPHWGLLLIPLRGNPVIWK